MVDYSGIDISFIVPVSEKTAYLRDAIGSALRHNRLCAEVVVVDDGPTHQTEEFATRITDEFPAVRWFRQEHKGPGAARNLGIAKARGDFLSFLDSDDLIIGSAFEELLRVARTAQSDIVCGLPECFRGWRRWTPSFWRDLRSLHAINTSCAHYPASIRHNLAGGKLFRLDFLRSKELAFPTDVYRGEDWQFNLTALSKSERVSFIPRMSYRYRKYRDGYPALSTMISAKLLRDLLVVHRRLNDVWIGRDTPSVRQHRDSHFLQSIRYHLRRILISGVPLCETLSLLSDIQLFVSTIGVDSRRSLPAYDRVAFELLRVGALLAGSSYLTGKDPLSPSLLLRLPEVFDDEEATSALRDLKRRSLCCLRTVNTRLRDLHERTRPVTSYLRYLSPTRRAKTLVALVISRIKVSSSENPWVFGERFGHGGDDTCYFLFRWMREHHPRLPSYLVVSRGYLKRIPRELHPWILIQGSFRHYLQLYRASVTVFNFSGNDLAPDWRLLGILRQLPKPAVRVFLNHGLTAIHQVSNHWQFGEMRARFDDHDIFTVSSEAEKHLFVERMGHPAENVQVTGITRFDGLHGAKPMSGPRKRVLYIPTWRPWLRYGTREALRGSRFYAEVFQLLHDPELHSILENSDASLTILNHHVFQPFVKQLQELGLKGVEILDMRSEDVQSHLRDSHLLITDYSSISFDFAYLNRPVIFYQFDQDQFFRARGGFFAHPNHELPGKTVRTRGELLEEIKNIVRRKWRLETEVEARISNFFDYRDDSNCQRVYEAIIKRLSAGRLASSTEVSSRLD